MSFKMWFFFVPINVLLLLVRFRIEIICYYSIIRMNKHFHNIILKATGANELFEIEVIQRLWSGYGEIVRVGLLGAEFESVVIKHVQLEQKNHPRGWNTDLSHQRKLKSYQVETEWYKTWSKKCNENCRIPNCMALESIEGEVLMVLEDLDASGLDRKSVV